VKGSRETPFLRICEEEGLNEDYEEELEELRNVEGQQQTKRLGHGWV
jgi:hypothetical protein